MKLHNTVFLLMLIEGAAFAQLAPQGVPAGPNTSAQQPDPAKFAQFKQKALERTDRQIAELQKIRSCIEAAQDRKAMQVCHPRGRSKRSQK